MATRRYDFVTGIETSDLPTTSDPTVSGDTVNKGYADETYSKLIYWGDAVDDSTALKAVAAADRSNGQVRLKADDESLWKFDSASSATEDGTTVIAPNAGTGRWLAVSGGSSSSGGGASGIEVFQNKNKLEQFGFEITQMDNSAYMTGQLQPPHVDVTGYLIENYTSGGSTMTIVWAPSVLNDSDKNYDATGSWSAVGNADTFSTSASSPKVGANYLTWNKTSGGTTSGIRFDRGSQNFSVAAKYRLWVWVSIPSLTNFTNVYMRMYADTTSNYRQWTATTDYAGNAIATGFNLLVFDLDDTTSSTTGGTGWTHQTLARYFEIGVTASTSGQTYTGIGFDGAYFSYGDIEKYGTRGLEFTIHDTSSDDNIVIDASNTLHDGVLTLAASVATNYTAGISNSDAAFIKRSTLVWSTNGLVGFNADVSSGPIATVQEARVTRVIRESLSGNYSGYVDMWTPQVYRVKSLSSTTGLILEDDENHSANLLDTNSVHLFKAYYNAGELDTSLIATRSLTANSTNNGSGETLITVTNTDVSVGDFVVKQHLSAEYSVVSATGNEVFQSFSYDTAPNGAQLLDKGFKYPNSQSVYAHWYLGGPSDEIALRDNSGNTRTLKKVGTPVLNSSFKYGKFAATGWASGSYLRTDSATSRTYDGSGELIQISCWIYLAANPVGTVYPIADYAVDGSSNNFGWHLQINSSNVPAFICYTGSSNTNNTATGTTIVNGVWNHVVLQFQSATTQNFWLNGIKVSAATPTTVGTAITANQALYIGALSASTTLDSSIAAITATAKIADMIVWRDGALLTNQDVQYLYNNGVPQFFGLYPVVRNEYAVTSQSGQKISMKAKLTRSTTAMKPVIFDMGIIKTG